MSKMTQAPDAAARAQQLVHDLGNSLSAARLRVELLSNDASCQQAQGPNIAALAAALDSARGFADELEAEVWAESLAKLKQTPQDG